MLKDTTSAPAPDSDEFVERQLPVNATNDLVNTESESTQTAALPTSLTEDELNKVAKQAESSFKSSRRVLYKSLAYTFYWYSAAKACPKYLDACFNNFSIKTPAAKYRNAVRYCLGIAEGECVSTVSKYGKVLELVESKIGADIDLTNKKAIVDKIVQLILTEGGLDAIAAPKNKNSKSNPANNVNIKDIRRWMASLQTGAALATFDCPDAIQLPRSGLFALVARIDDSVIEIVHYQKEREILENLLSQCARAVDLNAVAANDAESVEGTEVSDSSEEGSESTEPDTDIEGTDYE